MTDQESGLLAQLSAASPTQLPYALSMQRDLPAVLAAIAAASLQCYHTEETSAECSYAGPCAVGVTLPPAMRAPLDVLAEQDVHDLYGNISELLDSGTVLSCPPDQLSHWCTLQTFHDSAMGAGAEDASEYTLRQAMDLEVYAQQLALHYDVPLPPGYPIRDVTPLPTVSAELV